jgi:hypothetical protein
MSKNFRLQAVPRVFVSYRASHRELAARVSDVAREAGWASDTIVEYLDSPYPRGSGEEAAWLTEEFARRIEPGCTFIMMATEDAAESQWLLWEAMEGFTKAYRVVVCWLSGTDPLKVVFPLPPFQYKLMRCPQTFVVDARGDPERVTAAVGMILSPPLRYHVLLRLRQVMTVVLSVVLLLLPAVVLLVESLLPAPAADALHSTLRYRWAYLLAFWFSFVVIRLSFPAYDGPSRLAPYPVDKYIRMMSAGFAGPSWGKLYLPASFIAACMIDGINLFGVRSSSDIGFWTYFKATAIAALLGLGYERVRFNLFTVHVGTIYRKLKKYYGDAGLWR